MSQPVHASIHWRESLVNGGGEPSVPVPLSTCTRMSIQNLTRRHARYNQARIADGKGLRENSSGMPAWAEQLIERCGGTAVVFEKRPPLLLGQIGTPALKPRL